MVIDSYWKRCAHKHLAHGTAHGVMFGRRTVFKNWNALEDYSPNYSEYPPLSFSPMLLYTFSPFILPPQYLLNTYLYYRFSSLKKAPLRPWIIIVSQITSKFQHRLHHKILPNHRKVKRYIIVEDMHWWKVFNPLFIRRVFPELAIKFVSVIEALKNFTFEVRWPFTTGTVITRQLLGILWYSDSFRNKSECFKLCHVSGLKHKKISW